LSGRGRWEKVVGGVRGKAHGPCPMSFPLTGPPEIVRKPPSRNYAREVLPLLEGKTANGSAFTWTDLEQALKASGKVS